MINQKIQDYTEQYSSQEPELLAKLRKETYQKTTHPHMLSGIYQGRLLSMISKLIQPKVILELGTFTGYSALCLAEGLAIDGKLYTVDINDELQYLSNKYFQLSTYKNKIKPINGNGLEVIETFSESVDLVFLDADKKNYPKYLNALVNKLSTGGVIIADNVLWYGKVADIVSENDIDTTALQQFNTQVLENNQLEVIILPIRDGLSLIRKK